MQVHYYSYCFQDTLTHENKLFNFLNFIESSCLTTKKYITNNIKYLDLKEASDFLRRNYMGEFVL